MKDDNNKNDPEQVMVDEAVAKLAEHFDSVRIFVTRHVGEHTATVTIESGAGNFYAQLGQVREWLTIQEEHEREYARRKYKEGHDGDHEL